VNRDLKLAGDLNLGGDTLVLYGKNSTAAVSGNIEITSGARTISGTTGSVLDIRGTFGNTPTWFTKTVTNPGGGTLVTGSDVVVRIGDGRMDFGAGNPVTINGVLQVMLGGSVNPNPCYYGTSSILRFANTVDYVVPTADLTWAAGAINSGNPGIPWNVEVSDNGTDLQLQDTRALRGNLTISGGTFTLTPAYTGAFNIGGNWTRTGATSNFTHNNKEVNFDRQTAGNQTISVGSGVSAETFYDLEISPISGSNVVLGTSTQVNVINNLNFVAGKLDLGGTGNLLVLGNGSADGSITGNTSTSYLISSGGGFLRRYTGSNTSYLFPVGDATNYTPATIALSSGAQSNAYIQARVASGKNSNLGTSTVYLNRYWTVEPSGLSGSPVYEISYTYASGELLGGGSDYYPIKYKETGAPAEQGWCAAYGAPANPLTPPFSTCTTGTAYSHTGTTFTWSGLTTFSDFTAGGDYGPLPVKLLEFNAVLTNLNQVACNWSTATEINNAYFIVQRSVDAINYENLGMVEGAGNSSQTRHYAFTDPNPYRGISYYRLVQVDFNGDSETFDPAVIQNNVLSFQTVRAYPNPSDQLVNISIESAEEGNVQLQLTDISGRLVYTSAVQIKKGFQVLQLDLSGNEAGNYLITVSDREGNHYNLPLIYTGR
jgi:hypothetical protein